MQRRLVIFLSFLMCGSLLMAQKKVSDMAATGSFNDGQRDGRREMSYRPEGKAFVCVNGTNRYTRALYGGYTEWRLETSDRPIFAVYKKGNCRNVRFYVDYKDATVRLDSTDYCRASYLCGQRWYELKDQRWGTGQLRIEVAAMHDKQGAAFCFQTTGFDGVVKVRAVVSTVLRPKMQRSGDLGVDAPDCFDPAPDGDCGRVDVGLGDQPPANQALSVFKGQPLSASERKAGQTVCLLLEGTDSLHVAPDFDFEGLQTHWAQLPTISFQTPDAFINTLDGALMAAADGIWDGETFLHGAVGWRMPLAGWRAAYASDVLGWHERARLHFNAYAESQVSSVPPTIPHPAQDVEMNMARAEKRWGTQMYSDGYICRNPHRNNQMHHYDMNLNYVDELLWHFEYDADTVYMRKMWPLIQRHLAWEKRNYDADGDHLYDAYCCIWASDALYYNGGAVTHSSAYNYRGNRLAARIAELIGEDATLYRQEADEILKAMNNRLWLSHRGVWAEYQDGMGLKRMHESPAVWSVYTPIDCGACTPLQAYEATRYIDHHIPHIDVGDSGLQTISTSNWMPYAWSINNVAGAEVMHTALAYFEAGRNDEGFRLMKANILDNMYYGRSPGNFGQLSYYDAARGECYRDFGDVVGISSRTILQGLFGVVPHALEGKCVVRPGFPSEWDSVALKTPYIEYTYKRKEGKVRMEITQHFRQPLQIVVRQNLSQGNYRDMVGTNEEHQVFEFDVVEAEKKSVETDTVKGVAGVENSTASAASMGLLEPQPSGKMKIIDLTPYLNAHVTDIFKNQYVSPRPQTTTLQIPVQGVGEWCHPKYTPEIDDSVFRTLITKDEFVVAGVLFRTPKTGRNIIYTSLWDNYPDEVTVPLQGRASCACLLMAGSTNHMQSRIDNALVVVSYKDGSSDTLRLRNPDNWCPIEQDYYVDQRQFRTVQPRPYRVSLGTGTVSRNLGEALNIQGVYGREIPGGAAQLLCMPLDKKKKLKSLSLHTLSNDVVVGLMAITLQVD